MKKILAIGASTSSQSINRQLASHVAKQLQFGEVTALDLSQLKIPVYSIDEEETNGIPPEIDTFIAQIKATDAIVISLAEHNGSYAAGFKSILDWATRKKQKVWSEKPMFLLSTSPGGRGGATVLEAAKATFPHLGGNILASFSLPSFQDNFSNEEGVKNPELLNSFESALNEFSTALQRQ